MKKINFDGKNLTHSRNPLNDCNDLYLGYAAAKEAGVGEGDFFLGVIGTDEFVIEIGPYIYYRNDIHREFKGFACAYTK